jgi:glycosyltransferase involved in cell wall biosynthesis
MIRVLHLITTLQSGGAQAMLTNLVTAPSPGCSLSHAVIEMTAHDTCDERIRRAGVPLHTLGMTRGRVSLAAVGRFVQLLRRERPSLVQTWLYHADLLGLVALPVLRVPLVWNVRCSWHVDINRLAPRTCAHLSKLPTAVVVNSQAGQAVHQRLGYRPRRWCLIGNGFDLNAFKPDAVARSQVRAELGLSSGTKLIGIVGRWDPNKDYATFLAAAHLVSRRRDDVQFVMVGEGLVPTNEVLDQLTTRSELQGRVHLVGRRTDVNRLTAALDIAACTSVGEGFPNVVGEAMAAGVPCVTTDVGDARQLVGDAALVVPTRDPGALAATWLQLLAMDTSALQSLGLAGRARIAQHYSLSSVIKQYESLYEELSLAEQSIVRASP